MRRQVAVVCIASFIVGSSPRRESLRGAVLDAPPRGDDQTALRRRRWRSSRGRAGASSSSRAVILPVVALDDQIELRGGFIWRMVGVLALDAIAQPSLRIAESLERGLRGDIHREHWERVQGRLARRVDDVATTGSAQERDGCSAGVDRSGEIGGDLLAYVEVAEELDAARPVHGGVVHEDIDPPEPVTDPGERTPDAVGIAHIGDEGHGLTAEIRRRLLQAFPAPRQQKDGGTLLDKSAGHPETRATRCTGDDRDLPVERPHGPCSAPGQVLDLGEVLEPVAPPFTAKPRLLVAPECAALADALW